VTDEAKPALVIERVKLTDLFNDPANARLHGARNIEAITASLRRFGQVRPLIVLGDGQIVAGNGTYAAMRNLGWTECDVIRFATWDATTAAQYGIVDNRTAELAEWDFEALSSTLRGLAEQKVDLAGLGWEPHEVEPLLNADWTPDAPKAKDGEDARLVIEVTPEQRETILGTLRACRASDETDGAALARILLTHAAREPRGQ